MIPLLAHPHQRPGASIPLPVLPLFPLGAASVPSSWLSRLTWEGDQGVQSSGCSQNGCRSNIPWKTPWRTHCQELFLGLHISLCAQSLWENFHGSKSWE